MIFYFYFLKFIFNINTSKQIKNTKKINLKKKFKLSQKKIGQNSMPNVPSQCFFKSNFLKY